jgi:hypothetical protein
VAHGRVPVRVNERRVDVRRLRLAGAPTIRRHGDLAVGGEGTSMLPLYIPFEWVAIQNKQGGSHTEQTWRGGMKLVNGSTAHRHGDLHARHVAWLCRARLAAGESVIKC